MIFAPNITDSGGAATFTYAYRGGTWQKIGPWIFFRFSLAVNNFSSSNANGVLGLTLPHPSSGTINMCAVNMNVSISANNFAGSFLTADGKFYIQRTTGVTDTLNTSHITPTSNTLSVNGLMIYYGG